MRSFISSSKSSRRTRQQVGCLLLAAATLILLVVASDVSTPAATRQLDIVTHAMPPQDGSYYLAHDRGGHIDHHVLYHGIDRVAREHMRAAQVLFLGNSRLMFALQRSALQQFFGALGLRYYVLGFGHEEQDDFPARILASQALRPSWVVVNADGFFWDNESEWAAKTMNESAFDAWKLQFEAETTHAVRRRLHATVPQYVDRATQDREFVIYRSRTDGTWFVATDFGEGTHFEWPSPDRHLPSERSLRAAESFKRDVEARGGRLILCLVPAPHVSIHRAQALATHLGVPLVMPGVEDPMTIDGSHLSESSSRRFSDVFLNDLRSLLR